MHVGSHLCIFLIMLLDQKILGKDLNPFPMAISISLKSYSGRFTDSLHSVGVPKLSLNLTLAVAAVVALFAAFLVHHRVAAALGTQVPGDAHMAHTQQADGFFVVTVAVIILAIG